MKGGQEPVECLHPHVQPTTLKCSRCLTQFGLCSRHGLYLPIDTADCPKCPIALGKETTP